MSGSYNITRVQRRIQYYASPTFSLFLQRNLRLVTGCPASASDANLMEARFVRQTKEIIVVPRFITNFPGELVQSLLGRFSCMSQFSSAFS